jgi:hypothetical protein
MSSLKGEEQTDDTGCEHEQADAPENCRFKGAQFLRPQHSYAVAFT